MKGFFIKDDNEITPLPLAVCVVIGTILICIVSVFMSTAQAKTPNELFWGWMELNDGNTLSHTYVQKHEIIAIKSLNGDRCQIYLKSGSSIELRLGSDFVFEQLKNEIFHPNE